MTDFTKLWQKLIYAKEFNYIMGLTLPYSEMAVKILEDVHSKINHIMESDAIATQIHDIALKVSSK